MTLWAEQDALFLSPLITLGCLIFGVRYIERRFNKATPPITIDMLPPPPANLCEPDQPVKKLANDWGVELTAILDEMTQDGWIVLLDDAKDEISIVPMRKQAGAHAAIVRPTRNGKGWELK